MELRPELTRKVAAGYAQLAISGIAREYPNAPQLLLGSEQDLTTNRALHPAFYGCFDWHSAVHSHWLLVRLLRLGLLDPDATAQSFDVLDKHLTVENLGVELQYFSEHSGFEFPYGWAWLLRLWHECGTFQEGAQWRAALEPLAEYLIASFEARVESLVAPLRSGAHRDLGFALVIVLDVLKLEKRNEECDSLSRQSLRLYCSDTDYPWAYEPSGYDFTSSGLNEVLVMRRALPEAEFSVWLASFWPSLAEGTIGPVGVPVTSPDVLDGQGSHIVGLSLSRSWALAEIATYSGHLLGQDLMRTADEQLALGLGSVHSGGYMGEHWLATFATFALTRANED